MHMKLAKSTGLIAAFLLSASVSATAAPLASHVGDSYQIILTKESEQKGSLGSSNSHDRDTIVERVVGLRADGIELEYDFPPSIKPEERVSNWQFPIRIFKPFAGETQLSDKSELETRHRLKVYGDIIFGTLSRRFDSKIRVAMRVEADIQAHRFFEPFLVSGTHTHGIVERNEAWVALL